MASSRLAKQLKRYDENDEYDIEVLEWQIGIYLNYLFTFLFTLLLGLILNNLIEAFLSMISFIAIRKFSGGVHLKSLTLCAIVSAGLFSSLPFIHIGTATMMFINIFNCIVFILMSPNIFENLNPSLLDPYRKFVSILIVSSNLLIGSELLALTFFAQGLLIMPFWKGGGKSFEKRTCSQDSEFHQS